MQDRQCRAVGIEIESDEQGFEVDGSSRTLEDGAIFKGSIDMDPGEETARVALAPKPAAEDRAEDMGPGLDLKSG